MLLRHPELTRTDIARFRKILFPLQPKKPSKEKLKESELEAADFFEELHTRTEKYLASHLIFYKAQSVGKNNGHELDSAEAFLAEDDADYWSKLDYWKIEEFSALVVGRKPKFLTLFKAGKEQHNHQAAREFLKVHELLKRSCEVGNLKTKNHPALLLNWASEKRLGLSFTLVSAAMTNEIFDKETNSPTFGKEKVDEVHAEEQLSPQQKAGLTKEKETLQKLLVGMANEIYGYDLTGGNSPIPNELQGVMDKLGVSIDVGTIRKHLNEGKRLLPIMHKETAFNE